MFRDSVWQRAARTASLLVPLLVLGGCGGGGSGSGGSEPAPAPGPTEISVTGGNQKALAADALESATSYEVALLASQLLMSAAQAGGSGTTTLRCTLGGTFTLSGQIANAGQLAAGDRMTMTASGCIETIDGVTSTLDGTLAASVVSGTTQSNSYPIRIVMTASAANFGIASGTTTSVTNGTMQVDLTETSYTTGLMVLTAASITETVTGPSGVHASTLKNYRNTLSIDGPVVTSDLTVHVETDNPRLGNVYFDMGTSAPLVFNNGVVTSGGLKVTGASSALLATVTGNDAFSLQLDANGDGIYELNTPTTVVELQGLL